ncbi:RRP15-like protein [Notolabrus celidotus]|uniref:RRP15-like protein n=1 Tax=Notolabrus celidotus TaxID=1203425 RepID=UPI00148FAB27|nr:RRP15-like protein [Notolabrus celidotus]
MMAAVMKTHVQITADNSQPQVHDLRESDGGDEEEEDEDGEEEEETDEDGGSDEEEAEDEDEDGGSDEEEAEDEDEGQEDRGDDEDGGEEADSEGVGDDEGDGNPNAGWAEAMAKILGKKTPEAQSSILMKNKELEKVKERERQAQLERKKQVDKKRAWEMMSREKPDVVKDRETEKALQRVATRGVVQLFNAVRKHQRTVEEKVKEVGGSERKKAKLLSSVSKKDFIDVLRSSEGGARRQHLTDEAPPPAEDEKPSWSVLRDDFMMGASMKDWDKHSDEEEKEEEGGAGESDSDTA